MAQTLARDLHSKVNWIRERPIAHRGLHNAELGIFENTLSAAGEAIRHHYSIEVDLQPTADFVPMVFHDYDLERMTGDPREIRQTVHEELKSIRIHDSEDGIPSLQDLLALVNGKVGLVLELKGKVGEGTAFVSSVVDALKDYGGPVAVMSFHHHIIEGFRDLGPNLTLGLTAQGGDKNYGVNKMIAEKTDVDFVSYELENLDNKFLSEFRKSGKPVISWTVKSQDDAAYSAKFADQPTFEGFLP